jgi:hypothetical protein
MNFPAAIPSPPPYHQNGPRIVEARFAHIEQRAGCNQFSALDGNNEWISSCEPDTYAVMLVTYAESYQDILGRRAQFIFHEEAPWPEIRSVEGFTAQEIHALKARETLRLSPLEKHAQSGLNYGQYALWHDNLRKQLGNKHKPGRLALAFDYRHTVYLVTVVGSLEFAVPIWLGRNDTIPMGDHALDTDEKIIAFEQRCHDRGGIARRDAQSSPWQPPALATSGAQ